MTPPARAYRLSRMVARVLGDVPLIADAGTGYGAELNVVRTVREYEAAGVAAIQLEDQAFPKKCGHLPDKELVPAEEFTRRLGAALGARTDPDLVLIARTDARGPLGLDAAIERANAYAQAGADVIFVEAPQGTDEIERIAKEVDAPAGAYNTAARGLGPAEVYSIMCTGRTWFQVAPTIRYELEGTKPEGVSGKDIFLHIAGEYGDATNMNLEYGGPGLASVPMNDRRTIATQGAEVSADFSTFAWTMCCGSSSRSAVSRGTERPTPTPMPNTTTSGTSTCRAWSPTSRGPGR